MNYFDKSLLSADELKVREERGHRLQNELRHLLETLAIAMSTPARFVESTEEGVKNRIREIVQESKDKCLVRSWFDGSPQISFGRSP